MSRLSTAALVLCSVAAVALVRGRRSFWQMLEHVRRANRSIDANLAEIRRPREDWSQRSDEAIAESARREFDSTDLVALAEQLHLKPDSSR